MRKDWVLIIIIGLIFVIGIGLIGFLKLTKKDEVASPTPSSSSTVAGTATSEEYFSNDAKVMYFYSDFCHWCQKEKSDVFPEIAKLGFKIKPMNVGNNPDLSRQYSISGTPTFIAQNGDKLVGYQDLNALKTFLEQHK